MLHLTSSLKVFGALLVVVVVVVGMTSGLSLQVRRVGEVIAQILSTIRWLPSMAGTWQSVTVGKIAKQAYSACSGHFQIESTVTIFTMIQ